MITTETISTRSGVELRVETRLEPGQIEVALQAPAGQTCHLHWGVRQPNQAGWRVPPPGSWPADSKAIGSDALQTPFARLKGQAVVTIRLRPLAAFAALEFVLFFPEHNRWDNNDGRNYQVQLPVAETLSLAQVLRQQAGTAESTFERIFDLDEQSQVGVLVTKEAGRYQAHLLTNLPGDVVLHWGLARRSPHEWFLPPESMRPPGTIIWQGQTTETPFQPQAGYSGLRLDFPENEAPLGLQFVLKQMEKTQRWIKNRGANFYVPINVGLTAPTGADLSAIEDLAGEMVRAEMTHHSWTLMHRFNLAFDLLDRVGADADALALLYVWLRFSALRQLTWQRHYNTKPRELAHAQDRLTQKLSELFRRESALRPLTRLLLTTVGRGGEGQRIRDEILNIMHRHHINEAAGHFMEEWHQKLHNNTTPDDVVICEAYLEFLRTDGQAERFYEVLAAGGVTRQRLESFERPIRSQPRFVPHLKQGLIHDLENFLRILKASHSGTDFETAIQAARGRLDPSLQGQLDELWRHRHDPASALVYWVGRVTQVRRELSGLLTQADGARELLYLDLALEQHLRGLVEQHIHLRVTGDQLVELIARLLENVTLTYADPELAACSRHWDRLAAEPRFSTAWSLQAKSVLDRMGRGLGAWIDRFYQLLQPKAIYLGQGFQAETWTITLFSEEVVRGSSLGFVLSMLLHRLDPILRQSAQLGNWQILSHGHGAGIIEVTPALRALQLRHFDTPVVVVADHVSGDEEIPEGVTAVVAPDVTDIVSHVAVRARNARILFAACHETELLRHLKSLQGQWVELEVNAAGDVLIHENVARTKAQPAPPPPITMVQTAVGETSRQVLSQAEFVPTLVGGKSLRLAELRARLPEWIHTPPSVALPFGVFEKVLASEPNQDVAKRFAPLAKQAERETRAASPACGRWFSN